MGYGTGAIMAVPCGDQRDFEFACAFGLSIPAIQQPPSDWFAERNIEPTLDTSMWPEAFVGNAPYVNSANDSLDLNGISSVSEAVATTNRWLEEHERGEATINYKLRDWLFSRQRYWGNPSPSYTTNTATHTPFLTTCCPSCCRRPTRSVLERSKLMMNTATPKVRSIDSVTGLNSNSTLAMDSDIPSRHQRHATVGRLVLVRTSLPRPNERCPLC